MEELFNCIDSQVGDCVFPMVIAIFAFAFPLLIQTISRIDDKYKSTLLIKTFRQDRICKWFLRFLFASLLCCGIWLIGVERMFSFCCSKVNISLILLLLSTLLVIIWCIRIIWLIYVYYVPEKLFDRLNIQYRHTQNKELYFKAISNIVIYSVGNGDKKLLWQLRCFYNEAVNNMSPLEYPDYIYQAIYDANECLCMCDNKSMTNYKNPFYNLYVNSVMSETTLKNMWWCLRQTIQFDKDNFVIAWLDEVQQIIPDMKRNGFYRHFREFLYALGGLLMMLNKKVLLKRLVLPSSDNNILPKSIRDAIIFFAEFEKNKKNTQWYYSENYPFPNTTDFDSDETILLWINKFIAVTFINLCSIENRNKEDIHIQPQTVAECNILLSTLNTLENSINHLSNDNYETEICLNKNIDNNPQTIIDVFRNQIDNCIHNLQDYHFNISIKHFDESVIDILSKCFIDYDDLTDCDCEKKEIQNIIYFNGLKKIFDRNGSNWVDSFDRILPTTVVSKFQQSFISLLGKYNMKTSYVEEENLFKELDKMNLNSNEDVIIAIGLDLKYFKNNYANNVFTINKEKYFYKNVPIINIRILKRHSLYVFKKRYLPKIKFDYVSEPIITKYHLHKLDETYNIYTSLIDENEKNIINNTMANQVIAHIYTNIKMYCLKDAKCTVFHVSPLCALHINNQNFDTNILNYIK